MRVLYGIRSWFAVLAVVCAASLLMGGSVALAADERASELPSDYIDTVIAKLNEVGASDSDITRVQALWNEYLLGGQNERIGDIASIVLGAATAGQAQARPVRAETNPVTVSHVSEGGLALTETTLSPANEANGVCYVRRIPGPIYNKLDADVEARYGGIVELSFKMRAAAVWDVSSIPDDAYIVSVHLDSYLVPSFEAGHTTQLRSLGIDPRTASALDLWNGLQGTVYTQFVTPSTEGFDSRDLGANAVADLTTALTTTDWFALGVTEDGDNNGAASIAGWEPPSPVSQLIVDFVLCPDPCFEWDPDPACEDELVSFDSTCSGGDIVWWDWDFGDGGSSDLQNPTHTFTDPGSYTVTLAAGNICNTGTTSHTVVVNPQPVACFEADVQAGCEDVAVSFDPDCSTGDPFAWHWDFGDASESIERYPTHTYTDAGVYTVTLTITNGCGTDGEVMTDYITIYPPPACAITPDPAGTMCHGATGYWLCGPPDMVGYLWSPGGATTECISMDALAVGSHTFNLTVTDDHGCQSACSYTFEVYALPACDITPAPAGAMCLGAMGYELCGPDDMDGYLWSPGGATSQCIPMDGLGVGTHTFNLTVADDHGCQSTCSFSFEVYPLPVCSITATPEDAMCFGATGYELCGPPGMVGYLWSPGGEITECIRVDGLDVGSHLFELTVTDDHGCQSTCDFTFEVYPLPTCDITADPGDAMCFGATGYTLCGPDDMEGYLWSPGDDVTQCISMDGLGVGSHPYTLTVTDANGCQNTCSFTFEVYDILTCDITADPDDAMCLGATGYELCGPPDMQEYLWYPGGEETQCISMDGLGEGSHTFDLMVTDDNGCNGICSFTFVVYPLPECAITPDPAGAMCNWDAGYELCGPGGMDEYLWSPGGETDQCISMDGLPVGLHTFGLTVTDAHGCENSCSYEFEVYCCAPAEWMVDPHAFEFTGSITAEVLNEGIPAAGPGDYLAAFVNDECRGVTEAWESPGGGWLFLLTVYANDASGDFLNFKYLDIDECEIYDVCLDMEFVPDMSPCTIEEPCELEVAQDCVERPLVPGWNWFSLNVYGTDMSLDTALASLGGNGNYIKDQFSFAEYVNAPPVVGWFGLLEEITCTSTYLIRMDAGADLEFCGCICNPNTEIPVYEGWNWIGYIPHVPLDPDLALASIDPNGLFVKDQTSYDEYTATWGWVGSLTEMEPLDGHLLQMGAGDVLIYPSSKGGAAKAATVTKGGAVDRQEARASDWTVDPSSFEYNGSVTASIVVNGENVVSSGDALAAFVDGACRGVTEATSLPTGDHVFFLMMYGNVDGETVEFRYYDESEDASYEVDEKLVFEKDMVRGRVLAPYPMTPRPETGDVEDGEIPSVTALYGNHPNPFAAGTTVRYSMKEAGHVSIGIFNVRGEKVATLVDATHEPGVYLADWDGRDATGATVSSGVYFCRMEAGDYTSAQQMVLIK
jgi:PKD repeat protein